MLGTEDVFYRTEENMAKFVRTDLDLAITTARIALSAPEGSDRRQRNARIALRAHDVLIGFMPKLVTPAKEREDLDAKMAELRELLVELEERL